MQNFERWIIKFYIGNEINPNLTFLDTNEQWKFFQKNKNEFKNIRDKLIEISKSGFSNWI